MKNKKLATLVALPLVLSFAFGLSACSAFDNSGKSSISQAEREGKVVDADTAKANAIATMKAVQNIFFEPENAKNFAKFASESQSEKKKHDLDPRGRVWRQIEPLLGFPTDDASVVKQAFGDDPRKGEDISGAKDLIIITFMYELFDYFGEDYSLGTDLEYLNNYTYDFTSFKTLENGNLAPRNSALVQKNENDAYTKVKAISNSIQFNKDGTKIIPYFKTEYTSNLISSLNTDASNAATKVEAYLYETSEKGKKPKRSELDDFLKENARFDEGTIMTLKFNEKNSSYLITVKNGEHERVYNSVDGTISEEGVDDYFTNLISDTMDRIDDLDNDGMLKAVSDGKYAEAYTDMMGVQPDEITRIVDAAKISTDKKTLTAVIDGTEFTFAINAK